jgi:hypothetical protein
VAQYMVINEHDPEQCAAMEAGIPKLSPELKGTDFHCTCPGGVHGYFMIRRVILPRRCLRFCPLR